jgi:hypothetical protein
MANFAHPFLPHLNLVLHCVFCTSFIYLRTFTINKAWYPDAIFHVILKAAQNLKILNFQWWGFSISEPIFLKKI